LRRFAVAAIQQGNRGHRVGTRRRLFVVHDPHETVNSGLSVLAREFFDARDNRGGGALQFLDAGSNLFIIVQAPRVAWITLVACLDVGWINLHPFCSTLRELLPSGVLKDWHGAAP